MTTPPEQPATWNQLTEPAECARRAEELLTDGQDRAAAATAWALLAVAGELHAARRDQARRK